MRVRYFERWWDRFMIEKWPHCRRTKYCARAGWNAATEKAIEIVTEHDWMVTAKDGSHAKLANLIRQKLSAK